MDYYRSLFHYLDKLEKNNIFEVFNWKDQLGKVAKNRKDIWSEFYNHKKIIKKINQWTINQTFNESKGQARTYPNPRHQIPDFRPTDTALRKVWEGKIGGRMQQRKVI